MDPRQTRNVLEACLLVSGRPMSVAQLEALFEDDADRPDRKAIRESLVALAEGYEERGIELVEVAGGWRLQTRTSMEHWVGRLFQERPPRYSRALLETLVLIAYRQPITRGEIEEVRGVAVSSNIVRTLQERQWVREVGHKEVPGRPALLGTTSEFLDYFNLRRLDELPPLGELKDVDGIEAVLAAELGIVDDAGEAANDDGTPASPGPDIATDRNGDAERTEECPAGEGASTPLSLASIAERFAPDDLSLVPDAKERGIRRPASDGQGTGRPEPADELPERDSAQIRMMRELDDFAEEHRRELEARAARARSLLSNPSLRDDTPARGDAPERAGRDPGGRPDDGSSREGPPDGLP